MSDRRRREEADDQIESARTWASQHESFGRTSLLIPDGVNVFTVKKAGNYYLDIMPYRVGKGNPSAAEGKVYWQRTWYGHRGIGGGNDTYCCPKRCMGKGRCPVCEDVDDQFNKIDPSLEGEALKRARSRVGSKAAKERQLFNVIDRNNEGKGIQIWDISYHLFGKALKTMLDNMDADEDFDLFFHPKKGYTLKVTAVEDNGGGFTFYDCSTIAFKKREPYDMGVIDDAHVLDNIPKILTFDELLKIYLQEPDAEANGEDDRKLAARGRKLDRTQGLDFAKMLTDPPDDDDEPAPRPSRKPVKAADDDDAPPPRKAAKAPPPDDDDEPSPKPKKGKPAPVDDDDDEPPAPKAKAKPKPSADDDDEPAPAKGAPKTAEEVGIEQGTMVVYKNLECEVVKVSRDGTSLTLEDDDGEVWRAISPGEVKLRTPKEKPALTTDDDDEPAPKVKAKRGK